MDRGPGKDYFIHNKNAPECDIAVRQEIELAGGT